MGDLKSVFLVFLVSFIIIFCVSNEDARKFIDKIYNDKIDNTNILVKDVLAGVSIICVCIICICFSVLIIDNIKISINKSEQIKSEVYRTQS